MSRGTELTGGLRIWDQASLLRRDHAINTVVYAVQQYLTSINKAWTFHRVETPQLIGANQIDASYTSDDVFEVLANMGGEDMRLRPETTKGSYDYAKYLLDTAMDKPPVCVWQVGKSFRRELNDGARPSQLRYNEFTQLEFQCLYSDTTKYDYATMGLDWLSNTIHALTTLPARVVPSDRLPAYSETTRDIEVLRGQGDWKEMSSISIRKDFPKEGIKVLEIAIGVDRLVDVV